MIKVKNMTTRGEIYIYGTIVDDTDAKWLIDENGEVLGYQFPADIRAQLEALAGLPIDVHISSYGGDVSAAVVIYNMLAGHGATVTVYIDSIAASAASLIAFAGSEIVMPENTFLMIHNPQGGGFGDATYLLTIVDYLDKLREMIAATYEKHVKNGANIREMMDNETWIPAATAAEIFDNVRVVDANDIRAVAKFDVKALDSYKNVPEQLRTELTEPEAKPEAKPEVKPVDNTETKEAEVKKYIINILRRSYQHEKES